MSQATKCRNARKKAAKKRIWEAAQIRKQMAMSSIEKPPVEQPQLSSFKTVKIDRKSGCTQEEKVRRELLAANKCALIGSRHLEIANHYKAKIMKLQPIGGIRPLFLNENGRDYEAIRLGQEVLSAENLKRKYGIATNMNVGCKQHTSVGQETMPSSNRLPLTTAAAHSPPDSARVAEVYDTRTPHPELFPADVVTSSHTTEHPSSLSVGTVLPDDPEKSDSARVAEVYDTRTPHPELFPADVVTSSHTTEHPSSLSVGTVLPDDPQKSIDQREKDEERSSMSESRTPVPTDQIIQVATPPPHATQIPPQAKSLMVLLQQYPVLWQGLLTLKMHQASVQMYFVSGDANVAINSLPSNMDGSTPPIRIEHRMRLEQTQLDGIVRKMQTVSEHCVLLALPCGRDQMDVLQQSTNLQSGFITYLQKKQVAGIVGFALAGSERAAHMMHILPPGEFIKENLACISIDLLNQIAHSAHLFILITTI